MILNLLVYWMLAILSTAFFRRCLRRRPPAKAFRGDAIAAAFGLSWPLAWPILMMLGVAYAARPPAERER